MCLEARLWLVSTSIVTDFLNLFIVRVLVFFLVLIFIQIELFTFLDGNVLFRDND